MRFVIRRRDSAAECPARRCPDRGTRDELPQTASGGRKRVTAEGSRLSQDFLRHCSCKAQSCPVAREKPLQSLFMSPSSALGSLYRPFLSVRRLRGNRSGQASKSTTLRMRSRPAPALAMDTPVIHTSRVPPVLPRARHGPSLPNLFRGAGRSPGTSRAF